MQEGETGMSNVFQLFGEIAIQNEAANKAIADTTKRAGSASNSIKKSFEKIGYAAVKCGKAVAAGLAVGATAMGALLKSSIGEYADYEQFVGGIETLFKESQGKVMEYANSAYKTAGLSANEYMETVTSFSASLLQGLDGDTERAAEMANLAITDMADNANKMGSDMTSIQNAYQGFAKQNYTMLDNLKLGYGGTQTEMARLINDSGVLGAAITVTADTVNQVPFHKIVEAIHVIQDEMEITGTTAKEATDTISGSFSSFKATWRNLLVGLAADDQNVNQLFANFTNAGKTLAKNVISVIPPIIRNLRTVLTSAAQLISEEWANTIWPQIQDFFKIKFGIELPDWEKIKADFSEKMEAIESIFGPTIEKMGSLFSERIPQLLSDAFSKISTWFDDNKEEIEAFVDEAGDFVIAGLDMALDFFQWALDNSDAVAAALGVISTALVVGAIAAHPYAAAIMAVAAALIAISGTHNYGEEYFGKYTQEDLDILQQYIDAQNKLKEAETNASVSQDWQSLLDQQTAQNEYDAAKSRLDAIEGLYSAYRSWLTTQGYTEDMPLLDVPVTIAEDSQSVIQGELNGLDLNATVKLLADTSGIERAAGMVGISYDNADGSHANGLENVPFDGYRAILHKREAVLTASQADA